MSEPSAPQLVKRAGGSVPIELDDPIAHMTIGQLQSLLSSYRELALCLALHQIPHEGTGDAASDLRSYEPNGYCSAVLDAIGDASLSETCDGAGDASSG